MTWESGVRVPCHILISQVWRPARDDKREFDANNIILVISLEKPASLNRQTLAWKLTFQQVFMAEVARIGSEIKYGVNDMLWFKCSCHT